jgi:hypothetical protein
MILRDYQEQQTSDTRQAFIEGGDAQEWRGKDGTLYRVAVGQRFGRLLVLAHGSRPKYFICQCDCKNTREIRRDHLANGTKSCGCLQREAAMAAHRTHGDSGKTESSEYRSWRAAVNRCHNPNHCFFPNYGGRGITVCEEWRHDYSAFLGHVGRKPTPVHSLDRIDSNRGYEPGNVRWATKEIQARNTRANRFIEFRGERLTIKDWGRRLGARDGGLITTRLRLGWTVEEALTKPIRTQTRKP